MGWSNFDDVLGQLQAFGLDVEPGDIVVGTRQRCRHTDGGKEKRGWFQLYELAKADNSGLLIVGSYGCFWGAENLVQKIELPKADRQAMTGDQLAALKARIAEDKKRAEAETKRKNAEAAKRAEIAWRKCLPVGECVYLVRKGVESYGARFSPSGNMVIPMLDAERRIHGLQVIYAEKKQGRDKDFWPAGLAKKSHFFLIGNVDRVLLIAEGFATAASLHKATGLPVAVAFDAGNLLPVAIALHAKYKRANILICADDDYKTEGNPGVTAARNAALAVKGEVVFPVFAEERPTETKGPTDFNDLHLIEGLHVVAQQVETHLSGLGWLVSARATRGGSAAQGGGERHGRRQAVAVLELDVLVERFVPLDDGTGDYVFDGWTNKVAKKAQMLALLPAGVRGDDIKRHPFWIERGAYFIDQVGFDPSGKDENVKLNTWQGWPLTPVSGGCGHIIDLVYYLCGREPEGANLAEWILDWLAYPLQNPGAKMASAVVMHGLQGTGKSTLFSYVMGKIYGRYAKKLNQRSLEDKFNGDWARDTLWVTIEEIAASSEIWHVKGEFKDLVTGEDIRVNEKHTAALTLKNRMNFAVLSNEIMPLPIDNDDRRHCVIYTPPPMPQDDFDALHIEIENGGIPAFYDHLLRRDLSRFYPNKRPPMTAAKQSLIDISLPSEAVFIREWLSGNVEFDEVVIPVCPCSSTDLHATYARWARQGLVARPRNLTQFVSYVGSQDGWETGHAQATFVDLNSPTKKNRKMVVPSVKAISAAAMANIPALEQGEKQKVRWLTEGFFMFKHAMGVSV